MERTLSFTVNGQRRTITTDPDRPLLEVLREDLQLTGAKYGCGEGKCRACTVLLGGKSVASCITSVSRASDQTILTIEGLARDGKLHRVQEAFLAEGAAQCGFCIPGMIIEAAAFLDENPHPKESELLARMESHICRCCGYEKILKALKRAVA